MDESKLPNLKKLFPAWINKLRRAGMASSMRCRLIRATARFATAPTWSRSRKLELLARIALERKVCRRHQSHGDGVPLGDDARKGQDARKWTKKDLTKSSLRHGEMEGAFTTAATIGEQIDLLVRGMSRPPMTANPTPPSKARSGCRCENRSSSGPTKSGQLLLHLCRRQEQRNRSGMDQLATSKEVAAKMATNLGVAVTNQEAFELMAPELVKRVGFENMDQTIMNAEFNVLPDSNAQDPYVKLSDIYRAFDEIKASASRQKSQ